MFKVFQIGESFAPNRMDPCEVCECQASPTGAPVMCCKRMECPSLADCPRSCIRQPRPGQCCPTCDNRPECGYGYCSERSLGWNWCNLLFRKTAKWCNLMDFVQEIVFSRTKTDASNATAWWKVLGFVCAITVKV